MIKIILATLLSLSAAFCFGQTQADMDKDAYNTYSKADKKLNSVYQQVLKEYHDDSIFIKNLKIAQRLWIKFRDAEVSVKYPDEPSVNYGSVEPMCWAIYMTTLTEDRTEELQIWLTGVKEDICAGSVKDISN